MTEEEIYKAVMASDIGINIKRIEWALTDLFKALGETIKPIAENLLKIINTLEPYQRFELAHPRKKPRGSLRRLRKKQRKENNYG